MQKIKKAIITNTVHKLNVLLLALAPVFIFLIIKDNKCRAKKIKEAIIIAKLDDFMDSNVKDENTSNRIEIILQRRGFALPSINLITKKTVHIETGSQTFSVIKVPVNSISGRIR